MLRLTIIESPPDETPDGDFCVVGPSGATLGRVKENTWTLPDRASVLSRIHCEVLCEQGKYVLLDHSVNGTFLDGAKVPIGKGQKAPLKDRSTIQLGGYILQVSLETAKANSPLLTGDRPDFLAPPREKPGIDLDPSIFAEPPFVPDANIGSTPDPLPWQNVEPSPLSDNLFNFPPVPTNDTDDPLPMGKHHHIPSHSGPSFPRRPGPSPDNLANVQRQPQIAANPMDIPDDWYITPLDIKSTPIPDQPQIHRTIPAPVVPMPGPEDPTPQKQVHHVEPNKIEDNPPLDLDSCLKQVLSIALGDHADSLSTRNLIKVVEELATIVANTTPLLMQALASRTQFKDSLRLNQTMVRARDNNPLKPDTQLSHQQALQHMLLNDHPGLLQGRLAMEEGFRALVTHQTALLAALRPALTDTMTQLSPLNIQAKVAPDVTPGFALPRGKGKLWDTYLVIYKKMAESGPGGLEQTFMRSLAQHYEASLKTRE